MQLDEQPGSTGGLELSGSAHKVHGCCTFKKRCSALSKRIMALFGSTSSTASPVTNNQSQKIKSELEQQIAQELAVANATELVNKITENCFHKCIDHPQDTITAPQNACVNSCLERYMRSWNVVSKHYVARIQKEKGA